MHEYMKRLNKALAKGIIDAPSVCQAVVMHDNWCKMNSGGECNCDPDIIFEGATPNESVKVLADGTLKRINT